MFQYEPDNYKEAIMKNGTNNRAIKRGDNAR